MVQTLLYLLRSPIPRIHYSNEVACQTLNATEAEELTADIARVLRQAKPSKANISKEELRAIEELKSDKEYII